MLISETRGNERIAELCTKFPHIPRSIVIKSDVLREGTRHTPDLEEAGARSLPHSLIWNPRHQWNPQSGSGEGELITIPWKFDLPDETPVIIRLSHDSPYEIRRENGAFRLCRDGEAVEDVTFEETADWLFRTTSSGTLMAAVFQSWTREGLLGCALRYCEYNKSGDQCVYCCLDANLQEYRRKGIEYDLAVKPENAAEAYRAAFEEMGRIRTLGVTGGSLIKVGKEYEKYISLFSALNRVRDELRLDTDFSACITAPHDMDTTKRLKEAGVDILHPNTDCWEEDLWPVIVPGKNKYVGRKAWIDSIIKSLEPFGKGNVITNFVVGPETVPPHGFRTLEEGVESWRGCFEWLLSNEVVPMTSQWQVEVNSPWEKEKPPPTEYFLSVGQALCEAMKAHRAYDYMWHRYYKTMAWCTDGDFRRLVHGCHCDKCE